MYSTKEAKIFNANEGSNFVAGLHENVELGGAKVDKSPNKGMTFLEVTFVKDGKTVTTTEWKPTKFSGMTDEDLKKKALRQMGRMQQILECFYEENDPRLTFEGATFEEFAQWVANLLNSADKSIKVRLKAVYNDKGFIGLPSYARYKFIEKMDLKEGQSYQVELIEGTDKLVKPIVADKEDNSYPTTVEQPTYTSTNTGDNPLPF